MESFVIDTNFFVNQEIHAGFGDTRTATIQEFVNLALKVKKQALFLIPPDVSYEIRQFVLNDELWKKLISVFTIKMPSINSLHIPATIWVDYVAETRERNIKGMKIAEEKIKTAGAFFVGKEHLDKINFEKSVGPIIHNFRERYRNATRFQFVDSSADLHLILLAYETQSYIVSSDEGVIRWSRMLGVREQPPDAFRQKLLMLASRS